MAFRVGGLGLQSYKVGPSELEGWAFRFRGLGLQCWRVGHLELKG